MDTGGMVRLTKRGERVVGTLYALAFTITFVAVSYIESVGTMP